MKASEEVTQVFGVGVLTVHQLGPVHGRDSLSHGFALPHRCHDGTDGEKGRTPRPAWFGAAGASDRRAFKPCTNRPHEPVRHLESELQ